MANSSPENIGPLLVGDKPLPQSIESEKAVLSCLLLDPAETMDLVFSKIISEKYFLNSAHKKIFACLAEMRNDMIPGVIDIVTLTDKLTASGALSQIGGEEYLNYLLNVVPTTANVEKYIESVINAYMLRSLISTCSNIVGECYDSNGNVLEIIDLVERQVLSITEMNIDASTLSVGELMKDAIKHLQDLSQKKSSTIGLPTGYDIDSKITGLKPGELVVLAARPSIGKTALALDIMRNISVKHGKPAGLFSLEMGNHQIVLRLLCSEAQINLKDVRDGKLSNAQWANDIMGAGDRLRAAPIYIDDTPQLSSLELRQKARRMKQDFDTQIIIIDYLQLMKPVGANKSTSREQEVARLSADIKSLAKELNVPILLLCQLNRQAEQGDQPKLSHLRESGAIEQDADIVMLLHRKRETESEQENEEEGIESKLIIAKNRNGETGIVNLVFKPQWTRFFNQSYVSDSDVASITNY